MTWDFQGRNGTSKAGTGRLGGNMYHRRWELAGRETGRGSYRRRWDGGNWQVGRWEEEFSTGDGTSKVGTGRQGDGKRNLLQEMGHPRETNLPHDMGLPRPELAGRTSKVGTGRQGDGKRNFTTGDGTSKGDEFTTWHGTSKAGTGRYGDKKKNLPWEMWHPRLELAGREMGRGI